MQADETAAGAFPGSDAWLDVTVTAKATVAQGVCQLTLGLPVGGHLPSWAPGARGRPAEAARFRAGLVLKTEIEHAEDGLKDRLLQVGSTPRCLIPSLHPVTGAGHERAAPACPVQADDRTA